MHLRLKYSSHKLRILMGLSRALFSTYLAYMHGLTFRQQDKTSFTSYAENRATCIMQREYWVGTYEI